MTEPSAKTWASQTAFSGLVLAAASPLGFSPGLYAEYALPKLLVFSAGLALSALGVAASGLRGAPVTRLEWSALAAFAAVTAASLLSLDPRLSFLGFFNDYAYGVQFRLLCLAAFLLAARGLDEAGRRRLVSACLWIGAAAGLHAGAQAMGLVPAGHPEGLSDGRATGAAGSPVHLGMYLALLLPPAVQRALSENGARRAAAAVRAGCVLLGLAACFSRGAWLASAAGLCVYGLLSGSAAQRLKRGSSKGAPKGLWLAWLPFLLAFAVFAWNAPMTRRPTGLSDVGRRDAWAAAWTAFKARPLLGGGPETLSIHSRKNRSEDFLRAAGSSRLYHAHAHNEGLEALATTGAAGAAAQLCALWALGLALRRRLGVPESREEAAGLAGAFTAMLVNLQFNPASMESCAAAALLAAAAVSVEAGKKGPAAAWPLAAACAAALVGWIVPLRLAAADRAFFLSTRLALQGRSDDALAQARLAVARNPWEARYRLFHGNASLDAARSAAEPAKKLELADEAVRSAREFAALHPRDADSHYFLGLALMVRGQLAGERPPLEEGARALDAALEADPSFKPLLRLRRELALALGDQARAAEVEGVLARLEPLAKD